MADPTIQTFCCHNRNQTFSRESPLLEFDKNSYILVCLFSSALGIGGALYQVKNIFLRQEKFYIDVDGKKVYNIGRNIIIWLSVSDFCASLGIFFRSAAWKYFHNVPSQDDTVSVLFCAITSAWSQYFYTCTWIWTFFYAINVRQTLRKCRPPKHLFHMIVWTLAALLTAVGLSALYYPDANCHEISYLSTALKRILPNYCVTYIPIIIVMLGNPILYITSSREVDRQLALTLNQVTTREREIMAVFKLKFFLINLVFYLCWLPNIIAGIILWALWHNLPSKTIIVIWYIMAVTNPLQAFFNALVYRKWDSVTRPCLARPRISSELHSTKTESFRNISEASPLLSGGHPRPSSSSTSSLQVSKVNTKYSVNSCCSA